MSLHRGKVVDRGCECTIATRVEGGQYRAEVKCGRSTRQYSGPTNGAGVQAIALAVVKNFVTRLKAPGLTPAKARQILHDKGTRGRPLSAAARGYMGAVARGAGRRSSNPRFLPGADVEWFLPDGQRGRYVLSGKLKKVVAHGKRGEKKWAIVTGLGQETQKWEDELDVVSPGRSGRLGNQRKSNHWALPLAVGIPAGAALGAAAMHRSMKGGRKSNAGGAKPRQRREVKDVHGRTHVTEVGQSLGVGKDFYVSVIDGGLTGFLLGPYPSHGQALAAVDLGRRMAESVNDRAIWYAFGTSSAPHGAKIKTVFTLAEAKAFAGKRGRNPLAKSEAAYLMRRGATGGRRSNAGSRHRGVGRGSGPSMLQRGDRVCFKRDPRKCGTVLHTAMGTAIVQWDGARETQTDVRELKHARKNPGRIRRAAAAVGRAGKTAAYHVGRAARAVAEEMPRALIYSNPRTSRCLSCGYDVPRANPGGALVPHLNPKSRQECQGMVAVEAYHGKGTPVMVRGSVAAPCRRCNGARSVRLGRNVIACPTCCRKNKGAAKAPRAKSATRSNNFASHKPDCRCIMCSGAIYQKGGRR